MLTPEGVANTVRRIIRFHSRVAGLTDKDALSDLGLRNEDYIELARSLRNFIKDEQLAGSVSAHDLEASGVTVAKVIEMVQERSRT